MPDAITESLRFPTGSAGAAPPLGLIGPAADPLTEVLRRGARNLLIAAVDAEAAQWLVDHAALRDAQGHQQVVRNGHAAPRTIVTGVGPLQVSMPRVHDRRPPQEKERFTSALLPPYLRKAKSLEELIPYLYLKGVSTGDFTDALQALLGPDCPGLSATTVTRLVAGWQEEQQNWSRRDLSATHYVYVWADGVYFNIRLEEPQHARVCMLVLMGATAEGTKELIAVEAGIRESEQSWTSMLVDLQPRGLTLDPKLAIADGALGFWAAMRKLWPTTREQRCWVHKSANVLDKMPQHLQPQAKDKLHQIWMAATRQEAEKAFDVFVATYEAKYEGAVACVQKDRAALLSFYDFPAQHWTHIRTTNPIESTFATVRLRHDKTKGNGSRKACLAMVFKLVQAAQRSWRKLNGQAQIGDLIRGVKFVNGEETKAA
jgi:putative transposase